MQYLLVCYLESVINSRFREISSCSIKSNSFNNCIKRIFQAMTLFFLTGKQNSILNFIKQTRSLRISQNNLYLLTLPLQILRHPCQSSPSTSSTNKTINIPFSLSINLRPSGLLMNLSILNILKLISKISILFFSIFLS